MIPFPDKKYAVIYADPPWEARCFDFSHRYDDVVPYKTMTIEGIRALPVKEIVLDDALLFMWCVESHIPFMSTVMLDWGFEYVSVAFVWHKTSQTTLFRECPTFTVPPLRSCEFCFMGRRGKSLAKNYKVHQFLNSPRRSHSQKPDEVRSRIVALAGDVPRIELFARRRVAGWDAWGDEVDVDARL